MNNQLPLVFEAVVDRESAIVTDNREAIAYHQAGGEETVDPAWGGLQGFFQGMVSNVRACVSDEAIFVRVTITADEGVPS